MPPPPSRPSFCQTYAAILFKKQAAVRERQWELASTLFDDMEQRFQRDGGGAGGSYHTGKTRSSANPNDRGPRELRKTAVNPMAPTAVSYRLALQACASSSAESAADTTMTTAALALAASTAVAGDGAGIRIAPARRHAGAGWREGCAAVVGKVPVIGIGVEASPCPPREVKSEGGGKRGKREEEGTGGERCRGEAVVVVASVCDEPERLGSGEPRFAARALFLVRKMADAGVRLRHETVALAQQACSNSGRVGEAVEIRQVATDMEGREADEFLGQWRRRRRS